MKTLTYIASTVAILLTVVPAVCASAGPAQGGVEPAAPKQELMSRIDFGNSYVMGQSIKSGAVYLLNRKKSDIKSMLQYRENYRKEIREDSEVLIHKTR